MSAPYDATLDEVQKLARELRTNSDRLRARLEIALQFRPPPEPLVRMLQAECDQVLDQLTVFVALADGVANDVEPVLPTETRALRDTLERARALLDEVRP